MEENSSFVQHGSTILFRKNVAREIAIVVVSSLKNPSSPRPFGSSFDLRNHKIMSSLQVSAKPPLTQAVNLVQSSFLMIKIHFEAPCFPLVLGLRLPPLPSRPTQSQAQTARELGGKQWCF